MFTCLLVRKSCQKLGKKQPVLRNCALKRKKGFKGNQKQEVAQKRRKETRAVEVTFASEDDIVCEQILPLAEFASKRKMQPNDDESSSNEGIEDHLAPAEGYRLVSIDSLLKFVKRIHAQTPRKFGKSYAS